MRKAPEVKSRARQLGQLPNRERFDQVLDAAEELLREEGLSGFSIPVLAERLEFTRASIYKFFPTPYAVLNELTVRYLGELEKQLGERAAEIMSALDSKPIVTVGEMEDFDRRGGIINFYLEGTKVRFEINSTTAQKDGLKISSQLLSLGKIVQPAKEEK